MELAELLMTLVGRTIVGCGTDDDELMLHLDDGRIVWVWSDEDELMLTVDSDDAQPEH